MERFSFWSRGIRLAGDLYLPEGAGPWPVAVVGPGFAGVKEMLNPDYCRALAAHGIAGLAFDYAGFGASEGEPRQHVDPPAQARAYRDAVDAVAADPRFDSGRIGVWGPSLGGGHALVTAARHPRVKAAAVIVPFIRLPFGAPPALVATVAADVVRRLFRRRGGTVPVTGPPGSLGAMTTDGAQEWGERMAADAPRYRNEVTTASLFAMSRWSTARAAGQVRVPLRVILAADDTITPPAMVRKALRRVPGVDYVTFPRTHFELFDEYGDQVRDAVVDWLRQAL